MGTLLKEQSSLELYRREFQDSKGPHSETVSRTIPNHSPDFHTDRAPPEGQAHELTLETACVSRFSPRFALHSEASLGNSLGPLLREISLLRTGFPPHPTLPA